MVKKVDQKEIKRQINRLVKCMNFTIKKAESKSKDSNMYYDIYQMLGCSWEFIAKDCTHETLVKYRKDSQRCKNCGKIIYKTK